MTLNLRNVGIRGLMACCLGIFVLTAAPASAQYKNPDDEALAPADNKIQERLTAYRYSSDEGNFQVTWPSGCGKLRIRLNEPNAFVGEEDANLVLVHNVTCDRFEADGEGCSVTATFDARNSEGGEAGPEQVLARVKNALKTFNVNVVKQMPIKREFADGLVIEGVDVYGTAADGTGEFWVRGLLSYHDIYVLTAWSTKSDLWDNPVYQDFFNDFVPYAEEN